MFSQLLNIEEWKGAFWGVGHKSSSTFFKHNNDIFLIKLEMCHQLYAWILLHIWKVVRKHFEYPRPWCQTMWSKPPIFMLFYLHSYELFLHLHGSICCQNTCKLHVAWIMLGCLHKHFNIFLILFLHVNQHLMVVFNVFHKI